jgi:hypothetical protein
MARIIQSKNGKTVIHTVGEEISLIPAESNTYILGVDLVSGLYEKLDPNGTVISLESGGISAFTGGTVTGATTFTAGLTTTSLSATTYLGLPNTIFTGGTVTGATTFTAGLTATSISATTYYGLPAAESAITAVTYSDFTSTALGSGLNTGMLYIITDFQTCYDQPDFDYDGNPITSGNYKQGPVEPIVVLATSPSTISSNAYQPTYPNDRIQYDWYWGTTEVTNNPAFGRITERIDEFNNRTDYDHRNIEFKRYRLFTIREDQPLNGTVELLSDGTVNGVDTSFVNDLAEGDIICIPSTNPSFYEVKKITSDTIIEVGGDIISPIEAGQTFYKAIEETNDTGGYFSFKRTNVKTPDYEEYTTFGNAQFFDYATNNYVGNYANNYENIDSGVFILSNNVFLQGQCDSNKFGNYCYNNTIGTNTTNNVWSDYFYENVSTNDIRQNIIGHNFHRNLINVNLVNNNIGNDFNNNKLLAENDRNFENNIIGNGFNNNTIYSWFYKNEILDSFNSNIIGDFGNLTNCQFYRNYIRNNFNSNIIKDTFQNNQIGTNFQNNTINGLSQGNTILNGFQNNEIGSYFSINEVGNAFNNNAINDSFNGNYTKYGFNSNVISNNFSSNDLGQNFYSNTPSNNTLFGWSDLSTVSTRTYDTFYNSNDTDVYGLIVGKEFIMKVDSTSQYFKVKFTQWSKDGLGGGFQYVRTQIDSGGNEIGLPFKFTKVNYSSTFDNVVPGVLEIFRGDGDSGIFNQKQEGSYDYDVSPIDTEWNSIYTEPNNGKNFAYNKIGSGFAQNIIGNDFGFGGSQAQGNLINDSFTDNTIGQFMYNNVIGNYFTNNTIGDNFENNSIKNYFIGNSIANNFESNEIGDYFGQNGGLLQNTIFNNFKYNKIGNFFGNELNFPTVSGGTGADGGNIINDGFQFNQIGDNCIYCAFDLNFDNNKVGNDFWLNVFGANNNNNTIGNLFVGNVGEAGFPSAIGNGFAGNTIKNFTAFNQIGSNFSNNEIGNYFGNGGTSNYIAPNFSNNKIGDYFGDDGSATAGENFINITFGGNEIGPSFYNNTIDNFDGNGSFGANKIGHNFYSNVISGYTYYNEIGHDFYSNFISDEFHSNKISSNFANNSVYVNFNNNIIESDAIDSIDFTQYVGNISTYTLTSSAGGSDSIYTDLPGATDGVGINGTFDVVVTGGVVTSIVVNNVGQYYANGNTFVIDGSLIGGTTITDDVTITIDTVTEPSVYGNYNCTIFKRPDGNNRLSYFSNLDVLNVKDINQ